MTTNADAIKALIASKEELGKQLDQLQTAIDKISDEIDAKVSEALNNASYIPATDAFKKETQKGQDFLNKLKTLQTIFGTIGTVATAIDTVIKLIMTYKL